MKIITILCAMIFIHCTSYAQAKSSNIDTSTRKDLFVFGIGTGLDYGGALGVRFVAQLHPNVGFFIGTGIWESRVGANIGAKFRLLPKPQSGLSPYITAMYGSNKAREYYNTDLGKGFSLGGGIDLLNQPKSVGYFTLGASYALAPQLMYVSIGVNVILVKGR